MAFIRLVPAFSEQAFGQTPHWFKKKFGKNSRRIHQNQRHLHHVGKSCFLPISRSNANSSSNQFSNSLTSQNRFNMSAAANSQQKQAPGIFSTIAIPVCFVVSIVIYKFVFGASANFVDGDISKDPVTEGLPSYLGTIYKGGFVVPILLTTFFTVITFIVERFITLAKASGNGNVDSFVRTVKSCLDKNDIKAAVAACDKQRGSVANVVRAGLERYEHMEKDNTMSRDQKVLAIQKEVEEATTLEMPILERNLNIIATIASIATLLGLFGTVLGMIRSFKALGSEGGAPDATALATGISEALINTALGIGTSALAIIFYNLFTSRIDAMTYRIDEAGFSITQNFASKH